MDHVLRPWVRPNYKNAIWIGKHSITWLCLTLVWKFLIVHDIDLSSMDCLCYCILSEEAWGIQVLVVVRSIGGIPSMIAIWLSSIFLRCDLSILWMRFYLSIIFLLLDLRSGVVHFWWCRRLVCVLCTWELCSASGFSFVTAFTLLMFLVCIIYRDFSSAKGSPLHCFNFSIIHDLDVLVF